MSEEEEVEVAIGCRVLADSGIDMIMMYVMLSLKRLKGGIKKNDAVFFCCTKFDGVGLGRGETRLTRTRWWRMQGCSN